MQARAEMTEAQLVVSEAILGCSMNLMQAIKCWAIAATRRATHAMAVLIERATLMQREIVGLETSNVVLAAAGLLLMPSRRAAATQASSTSATRAGSTAWYPPPRLLGLGPASSCLSQSQQRGAA